MIDDLKPYPALRAVDSPWTTRFPSHWQLRRTKTLLRERVEKGFPSLPLLAATQSKGVVAKSDYETRTVTATKDLHLLKLVEPGDFVISLRSFQGGLEIAHARGIISPAYTILVPREPQSRNYLRHFFKSSTFIDAMTLFVTGIREGQNIDYSRLARTELPLPPPEEQAAIVRFLDYTNRRIDQFIRSKKKLIALLNEQKQAIIRRAVTRGLYPRVTLRNSGVPWLGEIPAHWKVLRAKYLYREVDERTTTGAEEMLSVSHLTGVTPRSEKNVTMFKAESYIGHKLCRPGDLVINTMWAWMAALGVSRLTGIVSPAYAVYRPLAQQALVGTYADALLRIMPYVSNFIIRSTGIRASRLRLYPDQFFRVPIIVPPREEQQKIVEHFNESTAGLSGAIAQAEREIALVREYRTRLISDVVTGQLDVRAAAASLPDLAPDLAPTDLEAGEETDIDDNEAP